MPSDPLKGQATCQAGQAPRAKGADIRSSFLESSSVFACLFPMLREKPTLHVENYWKLKKRWMKGPWWTGALDLEDISKRRSSEWIAGLQTGKTLATHKPMRLHHVLTHSVAETIGWCSWIWKIIRSHELDMIMLTFAFAHKMCRI